MGIVLSACGGGGTGMGAADAGDGSLGDAPGAPDDGGAGEPDAAWVPPVDIAPPRIPWLEEGEPPLASPVLTPCPEGWQETNLAGVTVCEPWPIGGARDCAPGEAHLLGSTGCAPLGTPCPSGDFAEGLPSDRPLVYVRADAAPGGDGTLTSPYRSLADATTDGALAEGGSVALGRGSYELRPLPPDVALFGACAAETVLVPDPAVPVAPGSAALRITSGALELQDLRLEPGGHEGVHVQGFSTVTLRAVEVRQPTCRGFVLDAFAVMDAERLVVRDAAPCASDTSYGLLAKGGVRARIRRSLFARSATGVGAALGTRPGQTGNVELLLEDSVVRDHLAPVIDGTARGVGMVVEGVGDGVEIRRCLFEHNEGGHVSAFYRGTVIHVEDTLFRAVGTVLSAQSPRRRDTGLGVHYGAVLRARRVVFTGGVSYSFSSALRFINPGPLELEDVVVAENKSSALELHANTARSDVDAMTLSVRRGVFVRNRGDGLVLEAGEGLPVRARFEDVRIGSAWLDQPLVVRGEANAAWSLLMETPDETRATLRVERLAIVDDVDDGIALRGAGAELTAEDVLVKNVRPLADRGYGLSLVNARRADLQRVVFAGTHYSGIEATSIEALGPVPDSPTELFLEDVVVRDTHPIPGHEVFGHGVTLGRNSQAALRRTVIATNWDYGLLAVSDADVTLDDVRIENTHANPCSPGTPCFTFGHALGVYGARLVARRFALDGATTCGVHFARGAEVDLYEGLVRETRIGACVQVDGYDLARLQNGVFFLDNERPLDATELPVPDTGY